MKKAERKAIEGLIAQLTYWSDSAAAEWRRRQEISEAATSAKTAITGRELRVTVAGTAIRATPLHSEADVSLALAISIDERIPEPRAEEVFALSLRDARIQADLESARQLVGGWRFFRSKDSKAKAEDAVARLRSLLADPCAAEVDAALERLAQRTDRARSAGLPDVTKTLGGAAFAHGSVQVIPKVETRGAYEALETWRSVWREQESKAAEIVRVGNDIRDREVTRLLAEMPLDALKRSTGGRVRLGVLERAGLTTVQELLAHGPWLDRYEGVGEKSAAQIWGAAESMRTTLRRETPVRIDVKARDAPTHRMLELLGRWGPTSSLLAGSDDEAKLGTALAPLLDVHHAASHIAVPGAKEQETLVGALRSLTAFGKQLGALSTRSVADPWRDFLSRPSDYLGWLSDIGFLTEDETSAHGALSEELVAKVRAQDLDTSHLPQVSLRGYQDFGARFALVQRKVVLGDEMGLGKTIEALAVLAHIYAKGGTHSVVVCPAAVVSQWVREIEARSTMPAYRVHGTERGAALRRWHRRGGVAVTTFETLRALRDGLLGAPELAALVVDEAHYIKNPGAQRTRNVRALVDVAKRTLFLTGTPLENRLDEFENLVGYLQPHLLDVGPGSTTMSFQRQVAPAYLRRNQEDVLTELPDRMVKSRVVV